MISVLRLYHAKPSDSPPWGGGGPFFAAARAFSSESILRVREPKVHDPARFIRSGEHAERSARKSPARLQSPKQSGNPRCRGDSVDRRRSPLGGHCFQRCWPVETEE